MDAVDRVYDVPPGPAEGSDDHSILQDKKGFSYRTLLGEMMYAYVTCRCDIGYAVTTLSKFSNAPAPEHYDFLKSVAKYLRRTKHWQLRYHRRFAIQDWKDNGDILLFHIPGVINPSDDLTKPLGWVLHNRHCRRLMGHYPISFMTPPTSMSCFDGFTPQTGEGVGFSADEGQTVLTDEQTSD